MQQPICAVFDKKTGLYDNPFTVRHVGEAVREFDTVRKMPETKFGKNPEDFDLMHIATWNPSQGRFENLDSHQTLTTGV